MKGATRRTTGVLAGVVLTLALAGCTTEVNLSAQPFPCDAGTSDAECPGGWHCGLNGKCHDAVPAAYACQTNADCEGWHCGLNGFCHALDPAPYACTTNADCEGWHCGLNGICHDVVPDAYGCASDLDCEGWTCSRVSHTCHTPDGGAFGCLDDTDCAQGEGWRCGLNGLCLDASQDQLGPAAGGRGTDNGTLISPVNLVPPQVFAAGTGLYTLDNNHQSYQGVAFPVDGGLRVQARFSDRVRIDNVDDLYTHEYFAPTDDPATVFSLWGLEPFWLDRDGGVWFEPFGVDAGNGVQPAPILLGSSLSVPATHVVAMPRAHEMVAFGDTMYELFSLDSSPPDALRISEFGNFPFTQFVSDGGTEQILDFAFLESAALAATPAGLFRAERRSGVHTFSTTSGAGTFGPVWNAVQPPGIRNFRCPLPDAGPPPSYRVVRFASSEAADDVGAELVSLDGGSLRYVALMRPQNIQGPNPNDECNTGTSLSMDPICPACPLDAGSFTLVGMSLASTPNNTGGTFSGRVTTRCRFALSDGGAWEASFKSDTDQNGACRVRNPNEDGTSNLGADLSISSPSTPGPGALFGAHGEIWFGVDGGYGQLDSWLLDSAPDGLAAIATGGSGAPQLTVFQDGWLFEPQQDLGLMRTNNLAAQQIELLTTVESAPAWLVLQDGQVLDAAQADNGLPPPVARAVPSAVPLQRPIHALLAPLSTGGKELLISSNDSILAGDVTGALSSSGAPVAELTIRLAPLPRVEILSLAAVPPAPAADGGVGNLLEAYALTSNALFFVQAASQQRWSAQPVNAPEGDWLEVWTEGAHARLAYTNGAVYSLPSRVQIVNPIVGDTVKDYQQACGGVYALGRHALYRLTVSAGSAIGSWQPVPLSAAARALFSVDAPGGALYSDGVNLYAFSSVGVGVQFNCH